LASETIGGETLEERIDWVGDGAICQAGQSTPRAMRSRNQLTWKLVTRAAGSFGNSTAKNRNQSLRPAKQSRAWRDGGSWHWVQWQLGEKEGGKTRSLARRTFSDRPDFTPPVWGCQRTSCKFLAF